MTLYGDALAAVKSVILIDERVQGLTGKMDRIADELRHMSARLTRLETIIEIARPDGAVLRVAAAPVQPPSPHGET